MLHTFGVQEDLRSHPIPKLYARLNEGVFWPYVGKEDGGLRVGTFWGALDCDDVGKQRGG